MICCCLFLYGVDAYAQSVPVPSSKKEEIGDLNKRLKQVENDKKAIAKKAAAAGKEYEKTQRQLVGTSASVQKNQRELHILETQLSELRDVQKDIQADLDNERASMVETIAALERIRRTPPEAMIAGPNSPIDTARGAMLLQRILPVLDAKAKALKDKSERYAANESALKEKQKKLVVLSEELSDKEKNLKKLVDQRKTQHAKLNSDLSQRKSEISKISKQAKNLNDLVSKLAEERARAAKEAQQKRRAVATQEPSRTAKPIKQAALPQLGKSQLPIQGAIRTKYNQTDDFGAKSKGVSIEGRGGALIVAPMGGVIRFAGFFKNYGNMVIIEHKNGYHSLIAGLEKIDTVVDQNVSAGEPLGHLYKASNNKPPTLYFELRHKGKSINPARKFTELG